MNLAELTTRLEKGEDLHTEFKEWPIHPDDLAPSIVAFANTDGGQVILGVDNQGRVLGIDDNEVDRATRLVDNVAFNNCEPPVTVVQEIIRDEQGRAVLVVNVPKGDQRPYRTNRGVYFVRTTSGRQQASREELLRLFQSAESLYYDETPVVRSRAADLDDRAAEELLKDIQDQGFDVADISSERLLNPTLYNIFLKVGLVTDAGSGIPRMIRVIREKTGREPDFRSEGNEFVVVIPRPS